MTGMESIRNVFCVGRNYGLHAAELGNAVPEEPMLFTKPTHAIVLADGGEIALPGQRGDVHYEVEVVVRIGRHYERGMHVNDLFDAVALGLDLTLRDVQTVLKQKGYPWLAAKGFRHAAPITAFRPFESVEELQAGTFGLLQNGIEVQRGSCRDMIFDLQAIADYCAEHYGLGAGDVLFTGTPAGVGRVADGDKFQMHWNDQVWGELTARLV